MKEFGIIGYPLEHSFSAQYFNRKFVQEHISAQYSSFPMPEISDFPRLCEQHSFCGLNVTCPHKERIIPWLDSLDPVAAAIGAVNVIRFHNGKRMGYNTDAIGFRNSILPFLQARHTAALVLGTGGAAKAVNYALRSLEIETTFVSRRPAHDLLQSHSRQTCIGYDDLNEDIMRRHFLIVNCTPLGMFPDISGYPPLPYYMLTAEHLLYDVIYNPEETVFLRFGRERGCRTLNGLQMLYGQAVAAWDIWKSDCFPIDNA